MRLKPDNAAKGRVVVTDAGDMLKGALQTLAAADADHLLLPDGLSTDEVAARCAGADVLIAAYVPFQRSLLQQLDGVGLIVRCGVGIDLIDLEAATERGIWVANVPDYAVHEVADHAMMLILAALRHLRYYHRRFDERGWSSADYRPTRRLKGLRLGVIGLGRTGSQLALRARAFGMEVVAYTPRLTTERATQRGARAVSLEELLETSDVISLHAPLLPETRHLLNRAAFARMRPGVVIINTARGALIDHSDLSTAIEENIVAAAALDVLEGEPHPDLSLPMFRRPNVTVTPHVAWYSEDAVHDLGVLAAEEALRYLRGERPRAVLNPEARSRRSPRYYQPEEGKH
jgi:phosphoglycerate dehydrogenase-like enzyme